MAGLALWIWNLEYLSGSIVLKVLRDPWIEAGVLCHNPAIGKYWALTYWDIRLPDIRKQPMSKNWAIAIGINEYDNLKPLKYAIRDAEAVRDFFRDEIKFEQIYHFAEGAPPIPSTTGSPLRSQPTYGALSRFLRVRFELKDFLNPEDNFWFFFAGHGKRYKGVDYLLPSDADPGNVEKTALSIREIGDRLRRSGAGNVILLIDACRDEDDRGGQGVGTERQQGVVSIFSCSPEQVAYEIDDLRQGAFTHALLEGLRIQGEGNCATVERLDEYLRHQVPVVNQRHGKPLQNPYIGAEPINKRHLILLPRQAEPADLYTLKLDAFEAERKENLQEARQLWRRVLFINPADPQALDILVEIEMRLRSPGEVVKGTVSLPGEISSREPKIVTPSNDIQKQDVPVNILEKIALEDWLLPEIYFIDHSLHALPGSLQLSGADGLSFASEAITPLLPLNPLLLEYFAPEDLANRIKFSIAMESGTQPEVKLELSLSGLSGLTSCALPIDAQSIIRKYPLKESNALGSLKK